MLRCAGPDEDLPRDMAHFEFICHAPSDYYQHGTQYRSYPVDSRLLGCVWTSFGPSIEPVDSNDSGDRLIDSHQSAVDDVQRHVNQNEKRSMTRSHKAGLTRSKDRLIK